MKRNTSIQLKAVLLLIVFSMNTVIGFACAIGIDMGFNTTHHHDEKATEVNIHVHTDGKKHLHHEKAAGHHHDSTKDSEKEGCCNDGVIRFQSLDKNLSQNANTTVPVFATVLINFFGFDIFIQEKVSNEKHIARFFHPPPPDIRILIRSLQI